ncbi:LapA family protein [bacterium]|nr:MAG: LapA family protein [bacterium]
MQLYLLIALLFAMLVALFAVQNAVQVDILFLLWRIESISLVVVILGSAFIGACIAGLVGFVKQLRLHKKVRAAAIDVERLEAENYYLRRQLEDKKEPGEKIMPGEIPGEPAEDEKNTCG